MICADREFPVLGTRSEVRGSRRERSTTWFALLRRIIPAPKLGTPKRSRVLRGVMASLRTRSLEGLPWKKKCFSSVLTCRGFENSGPLSPGGWTIAAMGRNAAFLPSFS